MFLGVLNTVSSTILIWTFFTSNTITQTDAAIGTELINAFEHGELAEVRYTRTQRDAGVGTELINAAGRGDLTEVRQLLGIECTDVNAQVKFHMNTVTALHRAAQNNHTQVVMLLLSCDADPNVRDSDGQTPLFLATRSGTLDIILLLLAAHADTDIADEYREWTALQMGISNVQRVKALINAGANLNLQDFRGATALIKASHYNYLDSVKELVSAGAEVNLTDIYGWSALMLASRYADVDVVNVLLAADADADIQAKSQRKYEDTNNGTTALMFASQQGRLDTVEALLSAGAQVDLQSNFDGMTALMIAVDFGHLDVTTALIEYGADMNIQNNKGWTALHVAVHSFKNQAEKVKILLKNGADVTIRTHNGQTVEDLAFNPVVIKLIQQFIVCNITFN